jgi:hypothetical protein
VRRCGEVGWRWMGAERREGVTPRSGVTRR